MNLKTHTAYHQITIGQTNVFEVAIIDAKGKIKFNQRGQGDDYADARKKAQAVVANQEPLFKRQGE